MFSHSLSAIKPLLPVGFSLQDLLEGHEGCQLSDYLSLSVRRVGQDTVIKLTTTDSKPVTYSAVISSGAAIDIASLVFVKDA